MLYLDVFIYAFCIAVAVQIEGRTVEYAFRRLISVLIFGFIGLSFS